MVTWLIYLQSLCLKIISTGQTGNIQVSGGPINILVCYTRFYILVKLSTLGRNKERKEKKKEKETKKKCRKRTNAQKELKGSIRFFKCVILFIVGKLNYDIHRQNISPYLTFLQCL